MDCPVVTFDGYTFPNVYGPYSFIQTPTDFEFGCNFLLQKESSSLLLNEESSMLAKVKGIKKTFTLTFNTVPEFSLAHANTGFNAIATVSKLENTPLSTATSRAFRLSVKCELPYTQDSGRIRAEMTISYNDARKAGARFTILYSASTSQDALAIYTSDTWVASMITTFFSGLTMEKVQENIQQDQNYKRLTVSLVYAQVLYSPSVTSGNEAKIVNAQLNYGMKYVSAVKNLLTSSAAEQYPLLVLSLAYSCKFDRTLVTTPQEMADIWQKNIRGRLLGQATTLLKPSVYKYSSPSYFIQNENVSVNPSEYALSASLLVGCRIVGIHIIQLNEQIAVIEDKGLNYSKLWDGQQGTYYIYSLGATKILLRNVLMTQFGEQPTIPEMPKNYGIPSGEWVLLKRTQNYSKATDGIELTTTGDVGTSIKVPIFTTSFVEQYLFVDTANSVNTVIGQITGLAETRT